MLQLNRMFMGHSELYHDGVLGLVGVEWLR